MKRIICLCLVLVLLLGVSITLISCSNASKSKCHCPHQIKVFKGYLEKSSESANEWLKQNPLLDIIDIQYAYGESWSSNDTTRGLIITYIEHKC